MCIRDRINNIKSEIRQKQSALKACKDEWFTINIFCDLAGEITGLNGRVRELQAKSKTVTLKLNSARNNLSSAKKRLTDTTVKLGTVTRDLDRNTKNLRSTEERISTIKTSIEQLNNVQGDSRTSLAKLVNTLSELDRHNDKSKRRSTVRRLRSASAELFDVLQNPTFEVYREGISQSNGAKACAIQ